MSRHTSLRVTAFACLLLAPCSAAAQTDATVRGRVSDEAGRPLAGVLVSATSSALPRPVTTRSGPDGAYRLQSLPAGPYVIAFRVDGRATFKHDTHLSPSERRVLDVTMIPEGRFEGAVVVAVDHESALERPHTSRAVTSDTLDRFPVTGGLLSAVRWMPGMVSRRPFEALVLVDDTPLRSQWRLGARPGLLDAHEPMDSVTTAGGYLPAEYGRLESGAVMMAIRPGGDRFSGALRTTLASAGLDADGLDATTPEGLASSAEYRFGGPLRTGRTWFFAAARHVDLDTRERTSVSSAPFATGTRQFLAAGKVTHAWASNQRVDGLAFVDRQDLTGPAPGVQAIGGTETLEASRFAASAGSIGYAATLGGRIWVTARFSGETGSRTPADGQAGDRASLSALQDVQSGVRWWSPATCLACSPESRTTRTWRVTGTYLLSRGDRAHELHVGYEGGRDRHVLPGTPANGLYELRVSGMRETGSGLVPVVRSNGSSWVVLYPGGDPDVDVASQSFFVTDRWQQGRHLTLDLGLRWDRFTTEGGGQMLLRETALSPRASVIWRLGPSHDWTVTAGLARYVDRLGAHREVAPALLTSRALRTYLYSGPEINTGTDAAVGAAEAVTRVLAWFDANGGDGRPPAIALAPGLTTRAGADGQSPAATTEWIAGIGRQFGWHSHARAEVFWRRLDGVPGRRVVPGETTTDAFGQTVDVGTVDDESPQYREYVGLSLQGRYRLGIIAAVGGHYTLSHARGTDDRVWPSTDPQLAAAAGYRGYVDPSWFAPDGGLHDDARHRLRIWGQANLFADKDTGSLSVTFLQHYESGRPYGVVGLIDVTPFVDNPGYATPPTAVPYFFAARDAFRTKAAIRTDLAVHYTRPVPGTVYGEFFARVDVLNLFDKVRTRPDVPHLVGRTSLTDPDRFDPFDPFREAPVQGVHWDVDSRLGPDRGLQAETLPLAFRVSFGVRF